MKDHDLLDAVGGINEKYINNAGNEKTVETRKRNFRWVSIAAAACVCLIAISGIAIPKFINHSPEGGQTPQMGGNVAVVDNQGNGQSTKGDVTSNGLYIPAIKLPEASETVAVDMIGLVVYRGHIYTQAEAYYGEDARRIESLIGDRLGTAKGNIDEWSTQDEYATEFASTYHGEVYSVKGYDTSFRISMKAEVEDADHNPTLWIQFLDCTNDITLTTGKDLFEDRLHISGNIAKIQWQSHSDWNNASGNIQNADIDESVWNEFWDAVDKGEFINTWNDNNMTEPTSNDASIYDTSNQAHLILTMSDGTVVRIRLIEGGYVGYDGLSWYFVQIPGNAFNTIFDACGGANLTN